MKHKGWESGRISAKRTRLVKSGKASFLHGRSLVTIDVAWQRAVGMNSTPGKSCKEGYHTSNLVKRKKASFWKPLRSVDEACKVAGIT
jgi:hypothetical protein